MAKLVQGVNDFASQKPWAAKYWSYEKNGGVRPEEVSYGSEKKFWFDAVTETGVEYSFDSTLSNIKDRSTFPTHKKLKRPPFISGYNDLKSRFPDHAKEFVSCGDITDPSLVKYNSGIKCFWACTLHGTFESTMRDKCLGGSGCPVCAGKKVGKNSWTAWDEYPELRNKWSDKNEFSLKELLPKSNRKVTIICEGHEYYINLNAYSKGSRCGFCAGKSVIKGGKNSLSFEYPELALEYMDKNEIPVDEINKGSHLKVWWEHSCGYVWETSVDRRVHSNSGCPRCNSGWSSNDIIEALSKLKNIIQFMSMADRLIFVQGLGMPLHGTTLGGSTTNKFVRGKITLDELIDTLSDDSSVIEEETTEVVDEVTYEEAVNILDGEVRTLNVPETLEAIKEFDSAFISVSTDADMVDYFVKKYVGMLWNNVWNGQDVESAIKNRQFEGEFSDQVVNVFLEEYGEVVEMEVPSAWPYSFEPNMMQKYVAMRMNRDGRMGNWSGTGAGKTASAVLSWLVSGADEEVIVLCPNAVVEGWEANVEGFSGWHVFNYEKLSTDRGVKELDRLVKSGKVGMVVIDEIHYAKFRGGADKVASSKRRMATERLLGDLGREVKVLGMSATPVINELSEAVSIIDLVRGVKSELGITISMNNIVAIHQNFIQHGIRYMPNYKESMNLVVEEPMVETTVSDFTGCVSIIDYEKRAVELKMDQIVDGVREGGVIYTHFIDGIVDPIKKACEDSGLSVGVYTGEDKSGLKKYLSGDVEVLIGSATIGTGVDGLQHRHRNMVFASLPWTDAEFVQIVGRIYRQGGTGNVQVTIPQTDQWCVSRMKLIESKRTLAKAVMDGDLPEVQVTEDQVKGAIEAMIRRLESEGVNSVELDGLDTDLMALVSGDSSTKVSLGDFSKINQKWNTMSSEKLGSELKEDDSSWHDYHREYREARENWDVIPYEVFSDWLKNRNGKYVADLGCGEALLDVHSNKAIRFDHIAINDSVISCDISDVSEWVSDGEIDIAIFSLALMGTNWRDYLDEASRIVNVDGHIWIAETKSHCDKWELEKEFTDRKWTVLAKEEIGKFVFFRLAK